MSLVLRKSLFSLNGFLTREQFAHPWSPHSLRFRSRQRGNKTSYCSPQMQYICCFIRSLLNPALGLPHFRGSSPLRKAAWGPQIGADSVSELPRHLMEWTLPSCCCPSRGAAKMRHCLWRDSSRETALTSTHFYSSSSKVRERGSPHSDWIAGTRVGGSPETLPSRERIICTAKCPTSPYIPPGWSRDGRQLRL